MANARIVANEACKSAFVGAILIAITVLFGCGSRAGIRSGMCSVQDFVEQRGDPDAISQSVGSDMQMSLWRHRDRLDGKWKNPVLAIYYLRDSAVFEFNSDFVNKRSLDAEEALAIKSLLNDGD